MSDETAAPVEQKAPETAEAGASAPDAAPAADVEMKDAQLPAAKGDEKSAASEEPATSTADAKSKDEKSVEDEKTESEKADTQAEEEKPAEDKTAEDDSADMTRDATSQSAPQSEGATAADADATPSGKSRRKFGVSDNKSKKLNKKASKAKILHLDAKPGDHFFARLKGFPPWPVVVCDEEMLPQNMLSSRPVTAARSDGTYRDDYADGAKKAGDRTYPVMYLHTNEFSWTRNTDLDELDPKTVSDLIAPKMRKDLAAAHMLAKEEHNLAYYKQVLLDFQEAKLADAEAKAARAKAKKDKSKSKKVEQVEVDDDVEMEDADALEPEETETKKSKAKKRKAEDEAATPQRSESVKKPKIKLTNNATPKAAANGAESPVPTKQSASKASKPKAKATKSAKDADGEKAKKEATAPKEPELTPAERHARKEKEILFLRHRLQKGLLNRDSNPKEEDMKGMSEFLAKLETAFPELEASIIKVTKINKVLKAILKLNAIPKEEEFKFKPRSQTLLDKWNKTLAADSTGATPAANGVNGTSTEATAAKDIKEAAKEDTTEPKEEAKEEAKEETKEETKEDADEEAKEEVKETPKADSETKDVEMSEDKPTAEEADTTEAAAEESSA